MDSSIVPGQPNPDYKDYAYAIMKGTITAVPIVGGIGGEIMSLVLASPLSKRQEKWLNSLAQSLVELREKVEGFDLESLSEDEVFVTSVMHATQSALRNHQDEKIEALRNAVLNSALPNAPDDDLQLIFINLVDSLTSWHLRILKLFNNPAKWAEENNKPFPDNWGTGGVEQVLNHAYPELASRSDLYSKLIRDLAAHDLANIPLGTMMTVRGIIASRTSAIGNQFLSFISTPPVLE